MEKCRKCTISYNNNFTPCPREGDRNDILFIGEAPGHTENKKKVPFVGKAGQFLRKYIHAYKLTDFSSMTNVVKCQPLHNRDPRKDEIDNCKEFLYNDLKEVKPKLIILVGKIALEFFLGRDVNIIKAYINKPFVIGETIVFPIYHPSYILRSELDDDYCESFNQISALYNRINPYYSARKLKRNVRVKDTKEKGAVASLDVPGSSTS